MGKIIKERKFRKYESGRRTHCDECNKKIDPDDWVYEKRKYRILRKEATSLFPGVSLTRLLEETILCEDCVPMDKVVKKDRV